MKKFLALLVLILMLTASLVSCGHPIEKFKERIDEAESAQMTMTMYDVPYIGTITMKMQIDGNITYTPETVLGPAEYEEKVGDKTYVYTQGEDGKWTKSEKPADEEDTTDFLDEDELFNPDNYEKVKKEKKTYKQKDDVTFDSVSDVVIKIGKDTYTMEMNMTIEGMTFKVKLVFSNFDEITLSLPSVE